MGKRQLYPEFLKYTRSIFDHLNDIPEKRKIDLARTAAYVHEQLKKKGMAKLIFICTHNSRRSHMGQIWAQAAASFYEVEGIQTYSGGTEATAFNPNAVKAMKAAGFRFKTDGNASNPIYTVSYASNQNPMKVFSKKYDDPSNPREDFCAIMTCSDADENCPIIPGAAFRVAITYEDPKAFDDTPEETKAYADRCYQIGKEMFYLFNKVR